MGIRAGDVKMWPVSVFFRTVLLSVLFNFLSYHLAWSAVFFDQYAIFYNGEKVGSVKRDKREGETKRYVYLTFTLVSLGASIPDEQAMKAEYNGRPLPFPVGLQNYYNHGAVTNEHTGEREFKVDIEYGYFSVTHAYPVATRIVARLPNNEMWYCRFTKTGITKITIQGENSIVFRDICSGTAENIERANIPRGATPLSRAGDFAIASVAEGTGLETEDFHLVMFGTSHERFLTDLQRQRGSVRRSKNVLVWIPLGLYPTTGHINRKGSAKTSGNARAKVEEIRRRAALGGFGQVLTYYPDDRKIVQEDAPGDLHPSHYKTIYYFDEEGNIFKIEIINTLDGSVLEFVADESPEESNSVPFFSLPKHNPDKDGDDDGGGGPGGGSNQDAMVNTLLMMGKPLLPGLGRYQQGITDCMLLMALLKVSKGI